MARPSDASSVSETQHCVHTLPFPQFIDFARGMQYNGMGHGYLNAMGVFPQAEDLVDEMGQFILECR